MRLAFVAAAAVLLGPAAALAEAAPKGMPQLDFANPLTIAQVVWLAVIFGLMYVLLSRWALPQVGRVIGDRTARIAGDLDQARSTKEAADAAARAARAALHQAQADSLATVNAAAAAAKEAAAAEAAALAARLDAKLAASEQAVAAARHAAMSSLHEVAAEVAATMVARLTGRPAAPATIATALSAGG